MEIMVNQGFNDRVRYTLFFEGYDSLETSQITGWEDDEKEIVRNEDYHGVFTSLSNNLKFYADARTYLKTIYEIEGVIAKGSLLKEVRNPKNDHWEFYYQANLDMNEYSDENGFISLKFNSGGLEELLKSRESEQVELDRETTLDGAVIQPLQTQTVKLDGRKIFLQSKWATKPPENEVGGLGIVDIDPGFIRGVCTSIPLVLNQKSHEEAQSPNFGTYWLDNVGEVGGFVFAESIEDRQLRCYGRLKFKITAAANEARDGYFQVYIGTYSESPYYRIHETGIFSVLISNSLIGQTIDIPYDITMTVQRGQSLSFEGIVTSSAGSAYVYLSEVESTLNIDEDSQFETSTAKFLLMHEVFERITEIIIGKKTAFYSEFYGRPDLGYPKFGNGAYSGITHGFWVRGFDKLPLSTQTDINPFKPITTSMRDATDSERVTHNIGLGIERIGYQERIRVEDLRYFYNRQITVRLKGQISNVKRYVAQKYNYSSVNIVYEGDGVYEEAFGLDEPNAGSNFTTCLLKVNQLLLSSKWLWGTYKREFTRRKPKYRFGTTDTNGDNTIFGLDLKLDISGLFFRERKWRDDFSQQPTGIYDPESATNLRMSPMNLILTRHGWVIFAGLTKYVTKFLRYASSVANSRLQTKLRTDSAYLLDPFATPGNGNAYSENGNIINAELKKEHYISEFIEFDHEVGFELMQEIEGYTMVGNDKIYNKYGMFEFKNENGDMEYFYLMSCKPNGNGRFQGLLVKN